MRRALVWAVLATLAACGTHADRDPALDARMRVRDAQFVREALPRDESGPAVDTLELVNRKVIPGQEGRSVKGALDAGATAAVIALDGDPGYWIVPAGPPDVTATGAPTYAAMLDFARAMAPGDYTLVVRAVDAAGHFGPPKTETLTATAGIDATPAGALVVALTWDTEADLDLHVVDPNGVEVWHRNVTSAAPPPPGAPPPDPNAPQTSGVLDFDSNAACVIDGRRAENVVWAGTAPSGHYVVRVDTASLCGEEAARWTVRAVAAGATIATAQGESVPSDTRGAHDRGAGVLALEIDVP